MKILLTSIGTRGDVEPFLAIGELLARKGHEVIFSFPAQFEAIVNKHFSFYALSPQFVALLESKEGRTLMGKARLLSKIQAMARIYKKSLAVNKTLVEQQYEIIEKENPDLIVHNVKCNYPVLWGLKHSKKTILVSPVPYFIYYVAGNVHVSFNKNFGTLLNKLTYRLSNFGLIKTIYDAQKHLPKDIKFSKSTIKQALLGKKLAYTISPQLFQRPNDWADHVQVLGYHERNKHTDWTPSEALIQFLEKNPKVLFITFGSMVNTFPEETSTLIYQVLDDLGVPTIINTAAGGLLRLDTFAQKEKFYFTTQIPYDWLLGKVYAVMHHGGAGTTHSALKYGCPSLIIPHIIDQFSWNSLIHKLGIGPKGISINKLSGKKLTVMLNDLLNNENYKNNATKITRQMADEKLEDQLYDFIIKA